MATILRRRGRIQLRLDERERTALAAIVDHLGAKPRVAARPAYDDAEMQAEYERWVIPDLAAGFDADLALVRTGLGAGDHVLVLTEDQVHGWLRAFNQLRVAAAATLGIRDDGWEATATPETMARPEYGMLMALGWLQEELVAALDT